MGPFIIGAAGVYTHVIADDLRESVSAALISSVVGIGLHSSASIAPLWILSSQPLAVDLLLPIMLGRARTGSIFGYLIVFLGSHCATVVVDFYRPQLSLR
ncbi:hypothetical protein [Halorussus aquaticus]|uniref:Uncharacterized protein n=1 Tax=Halorussus aquaticus TaxID=2953748 RepID=A0ABD5Q8U9_9EURY|nr:hypothetical protein [Halorussus aquaticus]